MYLYLNSGIGSLLAVVEARRRFALTVMEASEAAKIAHKLSMPGA